MAIDTTRQLIQQITNASSVGENTATRVGNAMEAMLNDVAQNANELEAVNDAVFYTGTATPIKEWAARSTDDGTWAVGDYLYSTSRNALRVCTRVNSAGNATAFGNVDGGDTIYSYGGNYYTWDGSVMTQVESPVGGVRLVAKSDIVDDLVTDDDEKPLSARQGMLLNNVLNGVGSGEDVLEIHYWGPQSLDDGSWSVGDLLYSTSLNALRKCTAVSAAGNATAFTAAPVLENTVYHYQGKYYTWDGTSLTETTHTETGLVSRVAALERDAVGFGPTPIKLRTQGGVLSTTTYTGFMKQGIVNDAEFLCYLHTPEFIHYHSSISITVDAGDTLSVFCYDTEFGYLAKTADIASAPSQTAWIRLQIYNASGFQAAKPISATKNGSWECVKGTLPRFGRAHYFSYEVKVLPPVDTDGTTFNGYTTRFYDNAYMMLPPNYNPEGDPVPLIIYTHGSDAWKFGFTNAPNYYALQQFLVNNGFAFCDCRGITNTYKDEDTGKAIDDGVTPIAIDCYCQLYEYMVSNYNIRQDGCYIYGKSSGGLEPALLSCLQPIPIRAAAGLAPMLSQFQDMFDGVNYTTNVRWQLERFGYDMSQVSATPTAAEILAQITKMQGYDPLICNVNADITTWNTMLWNIGTKGTRYQWRESDWNDQELQDALAGKFKMQPCPIKFWIADDDVNTPINLAVKIYKYLVDNGGGICKVRRFPAGTGGHHAVDTSSLAPTVVYRTKYAGDVTVPQAYAEMLDWFLTW